MSEFRYCPLCATEMADLERFGAIRPCCPNPECGFILFLDPKLVAVVIVEKEGQVLLGRRNHNPGKGLWSFPSGYVNRGEKVEEAALREVKEETNLDVCLLGLLGVYSETDSPIVLMVYRARLDEQPQELLPQEEEVIELGFFPVNDLPELAFPFDHKIMEDWEAASGHKVVKATL